MSRKSFYNYAILIFAVSFLWAVNASAAMWGAETSVRTFDVLGYYTNFDYSTDGGQDIASAYSELTDGRAHGQASSTLGLAPVLRAEAYHTAGSAGAWSTAWALEEYTNTGAGRNFTLNADLTADINNPAGASNIGAFADVYAIQSDGFDEYYIYPDTLFAELGAQLMVGEYYDGEPGTSQINIGLSDTVVGGLTSDSMSFWVDSGETFYILAILHTGAVNSQSYADAFNTLELGFNSTTDLTAGSALVPVPSALILLGLGLLGIVGLRRK